MRIRLSQLRSIIREVLEEAQGAAPLTPEEIKGLKRGDKIVVQGQNKGRPFRLEAPPELQDGEWVFFRDTEDDVLGGPTPSVTKA